MKTLRIALIALCAAALVSACKKEKKPDPGSASGVGSATGATKPGTAASQPAMKKHRRGRRGRWMKRRMEALKAAAKLTDEQMTKVAEVMKAERHAKRAARKANPGPENKEKRKEARAAARKASEEALKKFLKPEQVAAYTKLRDECRAKRKARREARRKRMKEQFDAFTKEAKLKPKQVEQLAALMKEARKAHRSSWRKMKGMDREARKAKRKEMRDAMDAKVKKVLDDKQFTAYQAWHEKMRQDRRKRWRERRGAGGGTGSGSGGDSDGAGAAAGPDDDSDNE